jgi:nucleoside recognition membrane protein YjiH
MSNARDDDVDSATISGNNAAILKFCLYSAIGLFVFFVPVTIDGRSTILLDHIVGAIRNSAPALMPIYALIVILLGAAYPFLKGTWNSNGVAAVFSWLKVLGVLVALLLYFQIGPAWLFAPDMGPFLFEKLVIPVGLLVPVGAVFLAMLVSYGLMEFIGVLFRPIMKPLWRTPGRSAVDAVASFVGSYSIGLLITNRVYKEGRYSAREACIIATGFSTVSATFMIVVARTLDLMDIWTLYFTLTMIITFVVTAISVRIPPLSWKTDTYIRGEGIPEHRVEGNLIKAAWQEGIKSACQSPRLWESVIDNLKDGFLMVMTILPTILSVGLIGLVLAKFTPVFDILGYVFYPFTWLLQLPEPLLAAKAVAVGIAEMFLPALLAVDAPEVTRFVIGVVSVSQILFFSASIPCILATEIPIRITELVLIWVQRTLLTLIVATPVAFLIL